MKEVLKRGMLKFENSFFSHVVRCALGMIIPLVLTGGIACAVRDFPVAPYQMFLTQGGGRWFYDFLTMVYEGTYGIFSVALVITIAYSYAMEKNESLENVVMYVVVALAAFSAQLNLGTEDFDVAGLGTTDRLDGIKRSHHASCYYRTRIHLVQSMDRHGFERRTGSLILYRASPSSLASDVQCRFLAKSTTSILAKGSGGITKTYSRKRT